MTDQVTVTTYPYRSDAVIAAARLAADGIASNVEADDEGGLNRGFYRDYGVRLVVAADDAEDAFTSLGIERMPLPRPLARAMTAHAAFTYPEEACGLVLFANGLPIFVCCVDNVDRSEQRYTIAPSDHHGVMMFAQRNGWEVGGVFHSHPRSIARPSGADIAGGGDPAWVHFIAGPVAGRSGELRAYRIIDGSVDEVSLVIGA
jgi:[CysO sulfur-carrier protein]-S-L-cysteine hydrolase